MFKFGRKIYSEKAKYFGILCNLAVYEFGVKEEEDDELCYNCLVYFDGYNKKKIVCSMCTFNGPEEMYAYAKKFGFNSEEIAKKISK